MRITELPLDEENQALFVFDGQTDLTECSALASVLTNKNVRKIVLASHESSKFLVGIRQTFGCDCNVIDVQPLSSKQSTQRMVHSILSERSFVPTDHDQQVFKSLGEFTCGSPAITEITSQVLLSHFSMHEDEQNKILGEFARDISLDDHKYSEGGDNQHHRPVSEHISQTVPILPGCHDVWETGSKYDAWDSLEKLISVCSLSQQQVLLLRCLSIFHHFPIPVSLASEVATIIATCTADKQRSSELILSELQQFKLIKNYPLPVVFSPSFCHQDAKVGEKLLHIPQCLADGLWKCMESEDRLAALCTLNHALLNLEKIGSTITGLQLQVNEVAASLYRNDQ